MAARAALPAPQQQQPRPVPRTPISVQQQAAAAQQRRRTSGAEWAAEGVQVRPTPQPEPGFRQSASEPSQETGQPKEAPAKIQENPPKQAEEPLNGAAVPQVQFPEKFLQFFPPEALMGFLQQAENAINTQVEPAGFAELMAHSSYSDGAQALVGNFEASEIWEAVSAIPGAESSPLLRRDGKRWMERLFKALKKELASKAPPVESAAP